MMMPVGNKKFEAGEEGNEGEQPEEKHCRLPPVKKQERDANGADQEPRDPVARRAGYERDI